MINPQWLELPMSRTNFHGPNDVRAIEVRLYTDLRITLFDKLQLKMPAKKLNTDECFESFHNFINPSRAVDTNICKFIQEALDLQQ